MTPHWGLRKQHRLAGRSAFCALDLNIAFSLALAGLLLCVPPVNAQSIAGSITGTVTDASGAVVPNATVTVTFVATNQKFVAKTNPLGIYNLGDLKDGVYKLYIEAAGFRTARLLDLMLSPRQILREDITLQVGDVKQETLVSGQPGLIETDAPGIGDTLDSKEFTTLPINGVTQSAWNYLPYLPMLDGTVTGTNPSFAGSHPGDYKVSIDGTDTDGGSGQSFAVDLLAFTDFIQEVKVDFVDNSADLGQLGQINVVVKSGANDLHGMAADIYNSPAFKARDYFATRSPTGVRQVVTGNVGGPVYIPKLYNGKNKTFFFLSFVYNHSATTTNLVDTVPTQAMRNGDFSAFNVPVTNPFTGAIYQNGIIPQSAINPASNAIQNFFYPLPNYGNTNVFASGNFRESLDVTPGLVDKLPAIRVDQTLGPRDSLYATWVYLQFHYLYTQALPAILKAPGYRPEKLYNIAYSHTFTPALLNEFRFGGGSDVLKYQPDFESGLAFDQSLGLTGLASNVPATIPGYPNISFSNGITGITTTYNYYRATEPAQHFSNEVTYFHGGHSLRFGVAIQRMFDWSIKSTSPALFGSESFTAKYSGAKSNLAYADFLFGVPTTASEAFAPVAIEPQRWAKAAYVTDTWRILPKLTLTMGIRYELPGMFTDKHSRISEFDPALSAIVVPNAALSQVSPLMPANYVPVISASQAGLPQSLVNSSKTGFAPRFGIAYRPFGDKTVFRGGYGVYYNAVPLAQSYAAPNENGVPYTIAEPAYSNTPAGSPPALAFPQLFPASGTGGPSTISLPAYYPANLHIPYSHQWNATVEHEQWGFGFRLSAVGTYSRQLVYENQINVPVANNQLFIDKPRPWPQYGSIYAYYNGANSNYNALNLGVTRRFKRGLQVDSQFVWAHQIGDDVAIPQNFGCLACERATDPYPEKLRWTNVVMYALPVGRGQWLLPHVSNVGDKFIGGWQLTVTNFFTSGQFLTPTMTVPDPTGTYYTATASPATITMRPDLVGDPNSGPRTIRQWFNTAAYAAPPAGSGRFGNSPRDTVVGPGENLWHAALEKYIAFSENSRMPKLRLDWYCDNVFNHPNWSAPALNLSAPSTVGVITSDSGISSSYSDEVSARVMAAAVRIVW
jgi:hypothetical protein